MIQTLSTVMQLFKGSYFSVGADSKHFWPNSAIAIARYLMNVMYELCFTCFKVEYKRSYNFHSFSNKTIIVIQLDMDFNSVVSNLWFSFPAKIKNTRGGGDSHMKQTGMLVGNFEFNP